MGPPVAADGGKGLQVHVSGLRKDLGDAGADGGPILLTRGAGYLLAMDSDDIDARRFERILAEGRRAVATGDAERAARRLSDALELWRGPALADFAYEAFARPRSRGSRSFGSLYARRAGRGRVYALHDGTAYGDGVATAFARSARRIGLSVAGIRPWHPTGRDTAEIARAVQRSGAQVVLAGGVPTEGGLATLQALREAGGRELLVIASDGFNDAGRLVEAPVPREWR